MTSRSFQLRRLIPAILIGLTSCQAEVGDQIEQGPPSVDSRELFLVRDSLVSVPVVVSAVAEPIQTTTLSARLVATVTQIMVQEGAEVVARQPLVILDSRDLEARKLEAEAAVRQTSSAEQTARAMAERFRRLFADSAATRAQWEQTEASLVAATSAHEAALAALDAAATAVSHSVVTAPYPGRVTARHLDPGALATPGIPLLTVEDDSRLRIKALVPPQYSRTLKVGDSVQIKIAGEEIAGRIEAVVASAAARLAQVNAVILNPGHRFLSTASAQLYLPGPAQKIVLLPDSMLVRDGDLVGVEFKSQGLVERRWVKIGAMLPGGLVEILSGVAAGDTIVAVGRGRGGV